MQVNHLAKPYLYRPEGRPPAGGYETVIELGKHQAESWEHAQRLILVVVARPDSKTGQLDLLPRYFFLVTNWPRTLRSGEEVLAHYRRRGTFAPFSEVRRLGEFNEVIGPHLSSRAVCRKRSNDAARLQHDHDVAQRVRGRRRRQLGLTPIPAVGVAS